MIYEKKNLNSVEGKFLNIIKAVYNKPAASIVLSGEKLKAVLQQGTRRQYPLSPLLLNRILEALARTVRKKNQ